MIDTILFDVDGTIVDTEHIIINALQRALEEQLGLSREEHELEFVLGIPGKEAVQRLIDSEEMRKELLKQWEKCIAKLAHHATLFHDIKELLLALKQQGFKLGLVTSKTEIGMRNEFDSFGLNDYFDVQITASDTVKHKPNPDPILKALEMINANANQAMYVGDSVYDMQSAKASNVRFALAKWGAKDKKEFDNVAIKLDNPLDLLTVLQNKTKEK
ncbi:HAD family hydrolase [Amphibacillus sp. Q70]|uniref:HAD family hydrolase n=1 Tax=Amphibacillus sp. Q70 TaxID=3453416 RepID=UPI003F860432